MSDFGAHEATTERPAQAMAARLGEHDGASQVDVGNPEGGDVETGVPAVDEALRALDGLEERPVDEHPAVFEDVHASLRRALSGEAQA